MNLSSFCFGILFLLKASFSLSAPHSYPVVVDEDEEALIDRLASLAAAVGPDAFLSPKQQQYPPPSQQNQYDFARYLAAAAAADAAAGPSSPDLVGGVGSDDILSSVAGRGQDLPPKLGPRQFGYKPNDIRFYLPAEQFPVGPQEEEEELSSPQQQQQQQQTQYNANPDPPPQQSPSNYVPLHPQQQQQQQQGQHEVVLGDDKSDFYFMKKKEQRREQDGSSSSSVRNYVPGPSHVMASEHSAISPGFSQSRIPNEKTFTYSDMYYIAIVAGCSAAAVVGIISAGICWYRIHERIKAAADVDYPAYGVTGPSKDITPSGGDRKLAQSAQMYHYQHQKQQMAALQKGAIQGTDQQGSGGSDVESDDDNEDGDYTVYECPGLAPAGEMEVKNPLFHDEQATTPATPAQTSSQQTSTSSTPHKHQRKSSTKQQHQQQPDDKDVSSESQSAGELTPSGSSSVSTSSSASSTATITSSTPKTTESPQPPKEQGKPAKEKGGKEIK